MTKTSQAGLTQSASLEPMPALKLQGSYWSPSRKSLTGSRAYSPSLLVLMGALKLASLGHQIETLQFGFRYADLWTLGGAVAIEEMGGK